MGQQSKVGDGRQNKPLVFLFLFQLIFTEIAFKLRDGGSYYLCDTKFSVMSGRIRRQINAIEHVVEHYASVNGIAVKHSYEEVVEMIRKAKGAK